MEIVLLVSVFGGIVCALIAANRNRSPVGWFIIGMLFPILGVILAIVLPSNTLNLANVDLVPEPGPYSDLSAQLTARAQTQSANLAALDKLVALHDRGLVTPQEFEAKKADLLARI